MKDKDVDALLPRLAKNSRFRQGDGESGGDDG